MPRVRSRCAPGAPGFRPWPPGGAVLLGVTLAGADGIDWRACAAEPAKNAGSLVGQPSLHVWIQSSRETPFLQNPGLGDADVTWACGRIDVNDQDRGSADNAICQVCRWFDGESVRSSLTVGGGTFEHMELNIRAADCLAGSFSDAYDALTWLQRDQLVHQHRYMAVCIEPTVGQVWVLPWVMVGVLLALACLPCALRAWWRHCQGFRRMARASPPAGAYAPRESSASEGTVVHDASGASGDAVRLIREIHEELVEHVDAPEPERKALIRRHMLRWHPDKHPAGDQATATLVVQFLNAQRHWFLSTTVLPESAPLLP